MVSCIQWTFTGITHYIANAQKRIRCVDGFKMKRLLKQNYHVFAEENTYCRGCNAVPLSVSLYALADSV